MIVYFKSECCRVWWLGAEEGHLPNWGRCGKCGTRPVLAVPLDIRDEHP